jgi:hypothetical protein
MMKYPQAIGLQKYSAIDAYHNITYGTSQNIPAFIDYTIKKVMDFTGAEIVTSAWIALPPNTSIDYRDKITLPDGSTPIIGSIAPICNYRTRQTQYIEVYVSKGRPGG